MRKGAPMNNVEEKIIEDVKELIKERPTDEIRGAYHALTSPSIEKLIAKIRDLLTYLPTHAAVRRDVEAYLEEKPPGHVKENRAKFQYVLSRWEGLKTNAERVIDAIENPTPRPADQESSTEQPPKDRSKKMGSVPNKFNKFKMRLTNKDEPPKSFLTALMSWVWQLPSPIRWSIFVIAAIFIAIFSVWKSLPSKSKEALIDRIFERGFSAEDVPEEVRPPGKSLLLKEMKDKQLIPKLRNAEAYLDAGGVDSKEEALKIFKDILECLSEEARKELDQRLFSEAMTDEGNGHVDSALAKYRALFNEVPRNSDKNNLRR